jgi:hypothetical protein
MTTAIQVGLSASNMVVSHLNTVDSLPVYSYMSILFQDYLQYLTLWL